MRKDAFVITDVTVETIDRTGFFCMRSKRDTAGYRRKRAWLENRLREGLRLKLLGGGARGFIEYVQGAQAWRAVDADDYMVIHCLWVPGRGQRQGAASALLEICEDEARQTGLAGVAMLTSEGPWLIGRRFLIGKGYREVGAAEPSFRLMARRFGDAPWPSLPDDWASRRTRHGPGLTVFRTDQCPFIDGAVETALEVAAPAGIEARVVTLRTAAEARRLSPSPYGVFGLVIDGRLLDYRPLNASELRKRLRT